ncbi:Atg3p NDAI_0F01120 [Naumovozyma dairenensis CBS 421]|uniref:Autophagy-related protein 3 n=1 Tax=Naumovozyma dairenensis (strain ATCC 10597 / BCRC 20456 / CBS 421 / NBRC 0211 / NRRL Y-12639) TaxID=1071378 RepID=G0WCC0_NAUDC|nr:hypothetical protein NDAI_0F01120 [Naumovozyma dairenensis CBS 421]CCD25431.1 hypothetical protein NDAI_0F01120 [Naumovozyma dairenensis CBS 421]
MLRSTLSNWREYLTPITHKSTFLTTGQITPEEFVQAGDYLVNMFPIWKWNDDDNDINVNELSLRDFLPDEKQFLVIRKVPCLERADDIMDFKDERDENVHVFDDDDDNEGGEEQEDTVNMTGYTTMQKLDRKTAKAQGSNLMDNSSDIDAMLQDMEIRDDDDDLEVTRNDDNITNCKRRYYDLYITYSTSYRVPKMYIVGFNGDGLPLTPKQMFEDISPDYRSKTATIEKLPFFKNSIPSVSIHPCKHANVMKVLLDKVRIVNQRRREEQNHNEKNDELEKKEREEEGQHPDKEGWEDLQDDINDTIRADQYLVVFLKFITSVTPSIEHDYTMEGW